MRLNSYTTLEDVIENRVQSKQTIDGKWHKNGTGAQSLFALFRSLCFPYLAYAFLVDFHVLSSVFPFLTGPSLPYTDFLYQANTVLAG